MADIAAYLHSRVIYASGRGDVRLAEVLVGDAKAGEQYFNGGGGCDKCHSPTGDLKGVGGKYDVATLQDRLVMPRAGRGGFGRPELSLCDSDAAFRRDDSKAPRCESPIST